MTKRTKTILASVLLAFTLALSAGCSALFINRNQNPNLQSSVVAAEDVTFTNDNGNGKLDLVDAVAKVERSVVAIEMQSNGQTTSKASGVIVDIDSGKPEDGEDVYYVLTCHHVISSMGDIVLYLPDDNCRNYTDWDYDENYTFKGTIGSQIYSDKAVTLVGGDKDSDVAVLKLDVSGVKNKNGDDVSVVKATVAPSDVNAYDVRRGESVFAVGNPSGELPGTVTDGIISYINREIYLSEVGYVICYQMDTEIWHGNSGGGLFNMYGQLIGLTNAGSEEYIGINYAIPYVQYNVKEDRGFVNIARQLIGTATETNFGYVTGRWNIGVIVQSNANTSNGVTVREVVAGSNAQSAGIFANDIIKNIEYSNGERVVSVPIATVSDFSNAINEMKKYLSLGDEFVLTVNRRAGLSVATKHITIKLEKQFIFCDTLSYPD